MRWGTHHFSGQPCKGEKPIDNKPSLAITEPEPLANSAKLARTNEQSLANTTDGFYANGKKKYEYKDPEKRRRYMRDLMRERRKTP